MSFEPLKGQKTASAHGRSCLIFYRLSGRKLQTAKNLAALLGLRDLIYLPPTNLNWHTANNPSHPLAIYPSTNCSMYDNPLP